MTLGAFAAVLLSAAPSTPVHLATVGLTGVDVDAKKLDFLTEYLGQCLGKAGVAVTTPAAVQAVLGMERQRQLLGCADEKGSCLAEISGALGVDGIVVGSVAKVGAGYAITLKIVGARDGQMLAAENERVSNEDALLDFLSRAAIRMAGEVGQKLGRPVTPAAAGPDLRLWALAPAGVAVAAGVVAGVMFGQSSSAASRLRSGDITVGPYGSALRLSQQGQTAQTAGWVLAAVATVGVAGAAVLFGVGSAKGSVSVVLVPGPNGAVMALGGSVP
jgi:hypothetical protein